MINIVNLRKKFGDQDVLNGVNLEINSGESLALIGGSGKGKSVLLRHIIGLVEPDEGKILVDNDDINLLSGKARQKLKERFGIVFQGGALFDSLTVFDNVAFPLREKTKLKPKEIYDKVFQELVNVDLKDHDQKYPAQLSGGMKKRVALARCLVMSPEIILFDEPTTGLDPLVSKAIHRLIRGLQQKRHLTSIIVSHEIPTIFDLVDRVAMLHNGKIIFCGTPSEIKSTDNATVKEFIAG